MGSDVSHFNVSLIVQEKVTRVSINHIIMKKKVNRSGWSNPSPSPYQPSFLTARPSRLTKSDKVFLLLRGDLLN